MKDKKENRRKSRSLHAHQGSVSIRIYRASQLAGASYTLSYWQVANDNGHGSARLRRPLKEAEDGGWSGRTFGWRMI